MVQEKRTRPDMATLFVADIHLGTEHPHTTEGFLRFLSGPAREAEALYILGDLFEVWVGDDTAPAPYPEVLAALRALADSGVAVHVMHGNRDFLLGAGFEAATGCDLIPDPYLIELHGRTTLLMHGDTLCTHDLDYLALRSRLRKLGWIDEFLALPAETRMAQARAMRQQSEAALKEKNDEITDADPEAVRQVMERYGVDRLIHGHTHRPGHHQLERGERWVLGDWQTQGDFLVCDADGCRREAFPADH